jgi:hypothetical protein
MAEGARGAGLEVGGNIIQIDDELLSRVGLTLLPDELRAAMLDYIGRTLDVRVAASLQAQMSDEQRKEFRQVSDLGEIPARRWLERNIPRYVNLIEAEFGTLCTDIGNIAQDILRDEGIEEP